MRTVFPLLNERFQFVRQLDSMDCGPACLKMVAAYHGRQYPLDYLRERMYLNREGVSLLSINEAAEQIGLRSMMAKLPIASLAKSALFPCILHWNQDHFVVLVDVIRKKRKTGPALTFSNTIPPEEELTFLIADPAHQIVKLDQTAFEKNWVSSSDDKGVALFLEPSPDFFKQEDIVEKQEGFHFLFRYLKPYRRLIFQLGLGMLAVSFISLLFPFFTQALVDYGIAYKNLHLVYMILLAQVFLFLGATAIDLIRSWLLLHVNTRISLNIVSDFLIKLLRLPIRYFDSKAIGDITQRISDHHRIETFLTGVTLESLFSIISILIFTLVLAWYSPLILGVFVVFSLLAILWIFIYQERRKNLDYVRFQRNKENQDKLYELISGMQEIKLNGSETSKRWEWERLQVKLFGVNMQSLALEQYQKGGFIFFMQFKNIIISCLAATQAIEGHISLGAMLSIAYIIGQTNGPLEQLMNFFRAAQDARISMDRMQEIHNKDNEELDAEASSGSLPICPPVGELGHLMLENVSFQYEGPNSPFVLKDINLKIPRGKVTAIVGSSGSGKTTLLKMLLSFYHPVQGRIRVGEHDLTRLSPKWWRSQCGTVMQDGFIFSDTITRNVASDGGPLDTRRFQKAEYIANLKEFVDELPLRYTTKIGNNGVGLSGGQKQRILIARAVYKNPGYLFFDEATSSLDANNESTIMANLDSFFENRTVVVVAHRLSTVRNADQIVVLNRGRIVETGTHESLTRHRGHYYHLVKNQLELGD